MPDIAPDRFQTRLNALSLLAAPLCLFLGWLVLMQRIGTGPDAGWFLSHTLLLLGALLAIPAVAALRILARGDMGVAADLMSAIARLGAVALVGQFTIDIAVGHLATDATAMSAMLAQLAATPGIAVPFHVVGPIAFYGGILALAIHLRIHGHIAWLSAGLIIAGAVAVTGQALLGSPVVTLLGFALLLAGMGSVGWSLIRRGSTAIAGSSL